MTDTQAKSGTASAATEEAKPAGEAAMTGSDSGAPAAGGDAGAFNGSSTPGETTIGGTPKFQRAPGMAPPPDSLTVPIQAPTSVAKGKAGVVTPPPVTLGSAAPTSGAATGTASVAVARASVRPTNAGATQALNTPAAPAVSGSARVTEAVRAARKTVSSAVGRGPRRARLHLKRIDPWSVMKFAFAVSFVLFVVVIVATSVLYLALDAMDVFNSVNKALSDIVSSTGGEADSTFRITAKGVIGGAALLGVVNVVLFTALATLGSFIYNVCADLVGGIELTLAEKD
ncbi:DUF3566 domain-containing protein [Dactylosporangium aurantiacum]|uniref:DUF3566 domain-containing protein n=1 Tax=Dactylosporangium aurantiacum TaxID=35754 RepID=A0A9Q9IFW3_9ACTN|nr:DUF3566 domain-containing protein [Dactylosporangium aurantiacum]MDG6101242.1 DUF3566 domain-containing protein [Dactylosporangium aurantiacum]UWZ54741.1 DUF3566 domain-containing protein [Dactylosporangium aurantiacum]